MAEILAGHGNQGALLFPVNGGLGRFDITRSPGFHLDKAEYGFVPANQVNFSPAAGRAVVAGHDYIAELAKIEVSVFFTAASGALVLRQFARRQNSICEPVERTKGGVGEAAAKHRNQADYKSGLAGRM